MFLTIKNKIKTEIPYVKKALRSLLAAIPGALLYYKTGNSAWFSVALVSVACCIPYGSQLYNIYRMLLLCIVYDILFSIQTYALNIPIIFALVLFLIAFFFIYSTKHNSSLRQYNTWIFIPSLYNAMEFHEKISEHISHYFWERIYFTPISFLCAFVACFILFPEKNHPPIEKKQATITDLLQIKMYFSTLKNDLVSCSHPVVRQSLRTAFSVLIAFCLVYFLHLKEGQWVIWSCASIILTYTQESIQKTKQRFLGLVFGIGSGFLLVQIIPQSPILVLLFAFILFLTLSGAFKNYAIAFGTRCATIMATGAALDGSVSAGVTRFENVVLGILIGTLATFFLWPNKGINFTNNTP